MAPAEPSTPEGFGVGPGAGPGDDSTFWGLWPSPWIGLPRGVHVWLSEELLLQEMLDFSSLDLEVEEGDLGASEGSLWPCSTS